MEIQQLYYYMELCKQKNFTEAGYACNMTQGALSKQKMCIRDRKMVKQTDWERSSYHNYYTKQKWGDPGNYDLMINSARTGIQKAVEIIMDYVK